MTAAEWARENNAAAPRDLLHAMSAALAAAEGSTVQAQLTSGARLLARRIAVNGCGDRTRALDLLALDALITSAMEASAVSPASCEAAASSLLRVISEASVIE